MSELQAEDWEQAKSIAAYFKAEMFLAADERIFIKLVDALAARDATIAEQAATINMMSGQLKFHRDSTDAKDKRIEELRNALSEYVLLVDFATLNGFAKLDPAALERHQAVKQSLLTQD